MDYIFLIYLFNDSFAFDITHSHGIKMVKHKAKK